MKNTLYLLSVFFCIMGFSCSNTSPNSVELAVDFSWEGMTPCSWGNPKISIGGVPEKTEKLLIRMYDSVYFHDHGEATITYDGTGMIKMGAIEELQGPCPPDVPGRYKITVKALDENDVVLGIGSKKRYFPEEKK
jgi:hypothetical protein